MVTHILGEEGHARVSAAIRAAEATTSGEIFVVVARRSGRYVLGSLLAPALAALLGGAAAAILYPRMAASLFVAQQMAAFAALAVLAFLPPLRRLLLPGVIARAKAEARAMEQFLAHNIHATAARTGVLIYVSLFERICVVVADKGVNDKVDAGEWPRLVAVVTERVARGDLSGGLTAAVERAGAVLAAHFPPTEGGANELPDRVVEL